MRYDNDMTAGQVVEEIRKLFGIGDQAATPSTILTNIANSKRRADCLSAIERDHFTVEVPDEDDPEETFEDCLLNWGQNPEAYSDTFGEALELKLAGMTQERQEKDDAAWEEYRKAPIDESFNSYASPLHHAYFAGIKHGRTSRWRLYAPARVGAATFRAGVSAVLVVEAAQRRYEYEESPAGEPIKAERAQRREAFQREIHAILQPQTETVPAPEGWRDVLNKTTAAYGLMAAGQYDSGAPAHNPTIAVQELLGAYKDDARDNAWEAIMAYADIRTGAAIERLKHRFSDAPKTPEVDRLDLDADRLQKLIEDMRQDGYHGLQTCIRAHDTLRNMAAWLLAIGEPTVLAYLNEWKAGNEGGVSAGLTPMNERGLQNQRGPDARVISSKPLIDLDEHKRRITALTLRKAMGFDLHHVALTDTAQHGEVVAPKDPEA